MSKQKKDESIFEKHEHLPPVEKTRQQAGAATHVHEHEHSDVDVRAIAKYTLILFGALAVVHIILWGVFKLLEGRADRADALLPINPLVDTTWSTKGPQLQAYPVTDRIQLQHREDSVLNSYGWIDKGTGAVRIPIDRAIDIVAEQGLPTRKEPYRSMQVGVTEQNGGQYQYGAVPTGMEPERVQPAATEQTMPADSVTSHDTPADSGSR